MLNGEGSGTAGNPRLNFEDHHRRTAFSSLTSHQWRQGSRAERNDEDAVHIGSRPGFSLSLSLPWVLRWMKTR